MKINYLPVFNFVTIEIPQKMVTSTDSMAQRLLKLLEFHNSMQNYVELLEMPLDSMDAGPPWEKKIKLEKGVLTTLYLYYEQDMESYVWNVTKSGYDSLSEVTFDDWLSVIAEYEPASGSEYLSVFDKNTDWYKVRMSFNYSSAGKMILLLYTTYLVDLPGHFVIEYFDEVQTINTEFHANGHVAYLEGFIYFDIYWNEQGNGYWRLTEEGEIAESGTW
ncbi:MAG: hypothetical protein ACOY90_12920 [Candidatus Zhuqueibacterota bacterium]